MFFTQMVLNEQKCSEGHKKDFIFYIYNFYIDKYMTLESRPNVTGENVFKCNIPVPDSLLRRKVKNNLRKSHKHVMAQL